MLDAGRECPEVKGSHDPTPSLLAREAGQQGDQMKNADSPSPISRWAKKNLPEEGEVLGNAKRLNWLFVG